MSVLSFRDQALVLSFDYKGLSPLSHLVGPSLFESVSQEAPDQIPQSNDRMGCELAINAKVLLAFV